MKLQLDPSGIQAIASMCEPSTGDAREDTLRVLAAMKKAGHDPLTRLDVYHVLFAIGFLTDARFREGVPHTFMAPTYKTIDRATNGSVTKTSQRGYYTLTGQTQIAAPTPKKKQAAAPASVATKSEGTTLTRTWLEEQTRTQSLARKVAALLKKKFTQESFEDLHSFVGLWFAKWGNAGTCDKFIEDGKPPTISILTIWVTQKLTHSLHRDAQDALQRETRGVRTQLEVRMRRQNDNGDFIYEEALKMDPSSPRAIQPRRKEDVNFQEMVVVEETPDLSAIFEEEELAFVRDIVRVRRRAADRYTRFLDYMLAGHTKEEAAQKEGISSLRATHLYQRVREDLRKAPAMLQVALKVLQNLADEPYSTAEDIEEEISIDEIGKAGLRQALRFLVLRGFATESTGSCYVPTHAGRTALELESLM